MEFYDFPYIGNFIIPTDELRFFRGVQTTNQMSIEECRLSQPPDLRTCMPKHHILTLCLNSDSFAPTCIEPISMNRLGVVTGDNPTYME